MGFGRYRFRRSFGNVASQFRGARPSTYPLFSGLLDQYPNAAAAYSLRALSSGWLAGDVVEVRRSSDSTTQDFTASQITNGQMLDWVKRPGAFLNSGTFPFDTLSNNATGDGFTAAISGGTGLAVAFAVSGVTTDIVGITFDISIVSGSPSLSLRSAFEVRSNIEILSTSGNKSVNLTATGSFNNFTFGDADNPSEFTISNIRFSTADGFVSTWYDQSGNANDATQATTTAQPKIVDAGSLVTGGLKFDGVDDGLAVSGQVLTSSSLYAASVMQHATGTSTSLGQTIFGQYQISTSGRFQLSASNSPQYSFFANATNSIVGLGAGAIGTSQTLISVNGDGSNAEIWRDGISKATDTYSGFTPATVDFTIGIDSDGAREFNGKIAEIIIYPSDQSANRVGIETNINAAYSIY
jgi:hypothetical protein